MTSIHRSKKPCTSAGPNGLQHVGVVTGGEPVGQRRVPDPGVISLPFGPLVTVQPHLGWIREVGADLDEPGPELGVEHVEVVDPDAPFGLGVVEPDPAAGSGALGGVEHPLELLGDDDRHNPEPAFTRSGVEIRTNVIELAVIPPAAIRLLQRQQRDPVRHGERLHLATEPVADLLDDRR